MQARVVIFPVKGRAWCFAPPRASAAAPAAGGAVPPPPTTLRDLWRGISSGGRTAPEKAEAVVDFVADKIGKACSEKWNTMAFEEKVKYYDIATEKRAEFEKAMIEYNKKKESGDMSDESDELIC